MNNWEQPSTMILKFPKRRMCDFKKVNITLWPECFFGSCVDIVTTYSFCFETSAEKSPWTKICYMENCLNTSIFTYKNVVYYIQLLIFSHFSTSLMVVYIEMGYLYVSALTQWTIVPNSKIENCDCLFCFC